jgi:protein-L-isoaspartate(D-aspartate) O-methyltransferase
MSVQDYDLNFAAARSAMIDSQLRPQGISDRGVLAAMGSVAREEFVPPEARATAYADRAVPLGSNRRMMAPAALGLLLQAIRPVAGERALVVNAAGGYSAALLSAMGLAVTLDEGGDKGSFDVILVDGALASIPDGLIAQLADGGRLGAAILDSGVTRLTVGRKVGDAFGLVTIGDAGVPVLPNSTAHRGFHF